MQKHSDRPEKRSSSGILTSGGLSSGNAGGQGHGGNVVGSGGATGGNQSGHGLSSAGSADSYWPKMDPATAYAHDRAAADYAAQSLMDPRLNPHHRDMMVDPRHAMEDLRAVHHSQLSAGGHGLGGYVDHNVKTSSAFSPIQGSMLQTASGGFPMSGSRSYPFYDPIGFPKHHGQVRRPVRIRTDDSFLHSSRIRTSNICQSFFRSDSTPRAADPTAFPIS